MKYATIKPRRVILCGGEIDALLHVKLDQSRLSIRVFGYDDWGTDFVSRDEITAALAEHVPTGIIYHPVFRDRKIAGKHLHYSLSGQVLYGIGEYCFDLDDERWELLGKRTTKNMYLLYYDLGTRCIRPMCVYPETLQSKAKRRTLNNREHAIVVAQIRLPYADSNFNEATIRLYTKRPLVLGDIDKFEHIENHDDYYNPIATHQADGGQPCLKLTGPKSIIAGDETTLKVQLVTHLRKPTRHAGVIVYFKTNAGYLPVNKITLSETTGTAQVTIAADRVPVGQEIIVKAGFKYYSHATCTHFWSKTKTKINTVLI